ncbi:MAG: hypothetical protein ABR518_04965 [Actinomycetota bacterium]
MSEQYPPPPPPEGTPEPGTGRPVRSPLVTAAAVLLIIGGALGVIFGLFLFGGGAFGVILAIVVLAVSALQIYAGIQVLGLHERGRIIGIVLAAIGALFALISLFRGVPTSIISILIDAFVIYALVTNADEFHA